MSQNLFAGRIEDIQLEDEIQSSYLDYAMSVIVGRALPDVRDGLKPVHKRILWAMLEAGYRPDRPHRKCAAVIGDVLEEVPPARRPIRLRRPRPDGAGLVAALPAGRRARQLRVRRRRSGRRVPVHRSAARAHGDGDAARHRGRDRRLRPELRRVRAAAGRPAQPLPEPAGERLRRDRGRHGHEHPAAQPRRDDRRGRALPREPRCDPGRADEVRQGTRLPDRRDDHGAPGHQGRLRDRARLDQGSRGHAGGRGRERPLEDRRDRAAVPGQQGAPRGEDRRAREARAAEGHRRPEGRVQPRGHAAGHRVQALGEPAGPAEPALQDDAAAGVVRRHHARARRRRAAHAEPGRDDRLLRRPPGGRGHAPHPVPAAQGRGARPHRPRPADRARPSRRGHRDHPRLAGRRGRAEAVDDQVQAVGDPGEPHPGHAAAAPDQARAHRAPGRAHEAARGHQVLQQPAEGPEAPPRRDQGGDPRDPQEARRRAPHARSWPTRATSTSRT